MTNRNRKTPPVPVQLKPARFKSSALHKKLLIDFDTGSEILEEQHKIWLRQALDSARRNAGFHVWIFGYASKLGDENANKDLSRRRMNSVLSFLQAIDNRTLSNVDNWDAFGEDLSDGTKDDNSPDWRAVEVHIFIGKPKPFEDPNLPKVPLPQIQPKVRPLPGGERWKEWAVASPGGAFVSVGGGGGFNIFFIKNRKTGELRGYIQPVGGVGAGLSMAGLKGGWNILQNILTGVSGSPPEFVNVETSVPVTWEEMESCLVRVGTGGGGLIKGYGITIITFHSSGIWQYNENGNPIKVIAPRDGVLFQFRTVGSNWQLGVNSSVVLGPLVRIPG